VKKYLVEVISQHLVRYVVEAREESHALDEVFMKCELYSEDWQEFSQKHIGDTILSSREVDEEEILRVFDTDNDYLKEWSQEKKLTFINTIEYEDKEIVPEEREWEYDGLGNKVYKGTMKSYDK
jgi:hypothetical protein